MKKTALILMVMMAAGALQAEDWDVHRPRRAEGLNGLSVFVNAGALMADDRHADFYSGRDDNANTIYRVLHSEMYGVNIWQNLTTQDLITDAVSSYQLLTVEEFAHPEYRIACQLGMGFRYDYPGGWGWMLRFDYAKLTAAGAFLLSADNHTGILSDREQFVRCGMFGQEERIHIDLGLQKRFPVGEGWSLELGGGLDVCNTKVASQKMEIAGVYYNILDVWDGHSPSAFTPEYEYINQGGIGLGGYGSLALCYTIGHSEVECGYTLNYAKIMLQGYESSAPQNVMFVRFVVNDFSFFD